MLPESSSEHGYIYDNLMWISFAVIFFVQTITQALLHYFAYKYHGREGQKALFYPDNMKLEIAWTIIPAIVLAGIILNFTRKDFIRDFKNDPKESSIKKPLKINWE